MNEIKQNFLQISAGLRSTVFMDENRNLFWCGVAGDIYMQNIPVEFEYKIKVLIVY